jgi:hypothetical protein
LIPLIGNELQILPEIPKGTRIQFEAIFTTGVSTAHNSYALQYPKMLGNGLARKPGSLG